VALAALPAGAIAAPAQDALPHRVAARDKKNWCFAGTRIHLRFALHLTE
jgi:hypothetical protein